MNDIDEKSLTHRQPFSCSLDRAHRFSRICPLNNKQPGNLWQGLKRKEEEKRNFANTGRLKSG